MKEHIDFANIDFTCPHCGHEYSDKNKKYLNLINKSKFHIARKVCENCKVMFAIAADMIDGLVGVEL